MPFFKFDNNKIFYDQKGEGEPLLLIHGNSVSSRMFDSEIDYYSQYYHVIYFDYPGHGQSDRIDKFRDDFWLYNAHCALNLLQFLGLPQVNVIGTSGGALTGLNLAVTNPHAVIKLITDSFAGERITEEEAEFIYDTRTKAKSETVFPAFMKEMHGEDWEKIVDQDLDLMLRVGRNNLPTVHGEVSIISAPVLGVGSDEDGLIPNIRERISHIIGKIPGGQTKFFTYGKHPFMVTQKDDFRKVALDFLK